MHVVVERKEEGWCNFCMSNLYKQSHMTLFVTFGLDPMIIQADTDGVWLK